jgi:hypothetical protein
MRFLKIGGRESAYFYLGTKYSIYTLKFRNLGLQEYDKLSIGKGIKGCRVSADRRIDVP